MENKEYIFDFEKLDVYKKALNFVSCVINLCKNMPKGIQFTLGDQFIRASLSIANNIAEGSGKISGQAKNQFYGYSLYSARECVPMITILKNENLITEEQYCKLREDCVVIAKMLGKLISSQK